MLADSAGSECLWSHQWCWRCFFIGSSSTSAFSLLVLLLLSLTMLIRVETQEVSSWCQDKKNLYIQIIFNAYMACLIGNIVSLLITKYICHV